MDMQKLLDQKRAVAEIFDARARRVIGIALTRRLAILERLSKKLSDEGVLAPDLIEQLAAIRGPEDDDEAFDGDLGVLAVFREITQAELDLEARRRQGELFDSVEDEDGEAEEEAPVKAAEAASPPGAAEDTAGPEVGEPAATESQDEASPADESDWVQFECVVCGEIRSYPEDVPTPSCPKACGETMMPVETEPENGATAPIPQPDDRANGTAPAAASDMAELAVRAEPLAKRSEFSTRRPVRALEAAGIRTVGDLLDRTSDSPYSSLNRIKGLGPKGVREAREVIDAVKSANGAEPEPDFLDRWKAERENQATA